MFVRLRSQIVDGPWLDGQIRGVSIRDNYSERGRLDGYGRRWVDRVMGQAWTSHWEGVRGGAEGKTHCSIDMGVIGMMRACGESAESETDLCGDETENGEDVEER